MYNPYRTGIEGTKFSYTVNNKVNGGKLTQYTIYYHNKYREKVEFIAIFVSYSNLPGENSIIVSLREATMPDRDMPTAYVLMSEVMRVRSRSEFERSEELEDVLHQRVFKHLIRD